jgi:hypothetical protein
MQREGKSSPRVAKCWSRPSFGGAFSLVPFRRQRNQSPGPGLSFWAPGRWPICMDGRNTEPPANVVVAAISEAVPCNKSCIGWTTIR